MKVALLGATKGMGRALARAMAERGDRLFLMGRNTEELERSARDLECRDSCSGWACPARCLVTEGTVKTTFCDLLNPETFGEALDRAERELDGLDTVVVTAGLFGTQEQLESDTEQATRVLTADYTNTVLFCEEVRRRLIARGGGTLCVFSSVAGDRGRKPIILYGSAKAGLSHYLEGLDHKFRAAGLKTVCVKPGFVKTGMTAGLRPPPFACNPQDVAPRILRAIDRGTPMVYVPTIWRYVMWVIRHLPRFVMRRINF